MLDKIARMCWVSSFAGIAQLSLNAPSRYDMAIHEENRFSEIDSIAKEDSEGKPSIIINLLDDDDDSFSVRFITNKIDCEVKYVYS